MTVLSLSRIIDDNISTHTLTWSVTIAVTIRNQSKLFQLTRSRGAWRQFWISIGLTSEFQLTRSRGAWPQSLKLCSRGIVFQLTRSRGAWRLIRKHIKCCKDFNSHAHVERDLLLRSISQNILQFQLTRSRGAWLLFHKVLNHYKHISTHTLTWSVTIKVS